MSSYLLRDASRAPAFFNGAVDIRVAFPVLFLIIQPGWINLALCLLLVIFFSVLGFFGITVPIFIKMIRRKLRGRKVYARPWWLRMKWAMQAKHIEKGNGIEEK